MAGRSHAMLHLNYPEGLRGTSLEAKVVYTRLLSDDALNHAGVLPLRIALWADDCEMPEGDIDKALRELEDKRYAYTDYKTHQVLVRTLIRKDGIADMPNVLWSACKEALRLRSRKLRRVLAAELRKLAPKPPDKINEKTGKRYVYPDPHATADAIDPGPPDGSERDPGSLPRTLPNPSEPLPRDAGTPGGGGGGGGSTSSSVGSSSSSYASHDDTNFLIVADAAIGGVEADFETWWAQWPRKIAKPKALAAYRTARKKKITAERLLATAAAQLDAWRAAGRAKDKIPHATTWLNQERWNDEVETPKFTVINNPESPWDGYRIDNSESPWAADMGWTS